MLTQSVKTFKMFPVITFKILKTNKIVFDHIETALKIKLLLYAYFTKNKYVLNVWQIYIGIIDFLTFCIRTK